MHKNINNIIVLIFSSMLILRFYLILFENIPLKYSSIFVESLFVLFFSYRHKWTWIGALILCIYGIVDSRTIGMFGYFYFSAMGFLEPVYLFFNRNLGEGNAILFYFPYFFYIITAIYLLLPSTKRFYFTYDGGSV